MLDVLRRWGRPPVGQVHQVHIEAVLLRDQGVELRLAPADGAQLLEVREPLDTRAQQDDDVDRAALRRPKAWGRFGGMMTRPPLPTEVTLSPRRKTIVPSRM